MMHCHIFHEIRMLVKILLRTSNIQYVFWKWNKTIPVYIFLDYLFNVNIIISAKCLVRDRLCGVFFVVFFGFFLMHALFKTCAEIYGHIFFLISNIAVPENLMSLRCKNTLYFGAHESRQCIWHKTYLCI